MLVRKIPGLRSGVVIPTISGCRCGNTICRCFGGGEGYLGNMKYLAALLVVFSLASCNTSIGLWRDSVQAYDWTKSKIQGMNHGGGGGGSPDMEYGAPVY